MDLKNVIQGDNETLFFQESDFGEQHTVNGVTCLCMVDDDRMLDRTDAAAAGVHLGEKLLFIRAGLLPGKPIPKAKLTLDGKPMYVTAIAENMGMYEIRLTANKS